MTHPAPVGATQRKIDSIIELAIELAGCSDRHRILLTGTRDSDPVSDWRSRGYRRVATMAVSRLPRGQYDVAVIEWRQHSIRALETMLDWLVHFLSPQGVMVVWIDGAPDTALARRNLRSAIERLGFHVEAGKRRQDGFAVLASRVSAGQRTMAA